MVRILETYLSEIGRERLLTPDEEVDLARKARAGDGAARRRLVSANLRFVVSVARGYRGRGLPLIDLVNEGNLGLVRAADRFDPERGVRFVSYAHFWVRRSMTQAIARQAERRSSNEPAPHRISLDEPVLGGSCTLAEVLADDGAPRTDARVVREGLRSALEASLGDLPGREGDVLRGYFGLGPESPRTLSEIATDFGVTRERVRQLKERGLARLRASASRHGLNGFAAEGEPSLSRPGGSHLGRPKRRRYTD